jgi:S1-C subfamily serine protease
MTPTGDEAPPSPSKARRRWWRPGRIAAGAGVLALVAALVALFVIDDGLSGRPDVSSKDVNGIVNQKVSSAITQLQSEPPVGTKVYAAALDGLVVIEAKQPGKSGTEDLGTGIIVNTQGEILTARHVVVGSSAIKLTFADGTVATGSIESSDASDDIAVLTASKLPSPLVPEVLGGGAQVGDQAFVLGNPLGLDASLSAGVISGLNRTFPLAPGDTLSGMIQFDAAVNPGNSGGPLLNAQGQVMGIVTGLANAAGNDEFAGIGFAVPIGTAGGAVGAPPK